MGKSSSWRSTRDFRVIDNNNFVRAKTTLETLSSIEAEQVEHDLDAVDGYCK